MFPFDNLPNPVNDKTLGISNIKETKDITRFVYGMRVD